MPIITDKKQSFTLKETQKQCKLCTEKGTRTSRIVQCDVCLFWLCLECSSIPESLYEYTTDHNITYNYICNPCKDDLPQIRDLMQMKDKQKKMEEDLIRIDQRSEDHEKRLKTIEKVLRDNKLDDEEYPKLPLYAEKAKKLEDLLSNQEDATKILDKKLQEHTDITEEEKRKAAKQRNLIIYGVPEKSTDSKEQMKEDFNTIRALYENRVPIEANEITELIRLGSKENSKIRPIRIALASPEKRLKLLRNNINLRIHDEEFEYCECKREPGHHVHVNVTNDKTKQERETEKALREELYRRRNDGEENIIIKKGKIVKKSRSNAQTRWVDIFQDV